jgi:hypothetical protein
MKKQQRPDEVITNSRMKAFHACPRLHHYEYDLGYRAVSAGALRDFGTAFHAGLEAWWGAYRDGKPEAATDLALEAIATAGDDTTSVDEAGVIKARLLMAGYGARWAASMDDYEVLGVEEQFLMQLTTPTGRRARGLKLAGKLDGIVRRRSNGTIWQVEHKTTGADLGAGSPYWQRLRLDSQVSVYFEGAAALGHQLAGCLYDVVVRPEQRPYQATPVDKRKFTKDGRLYANQREQDETMEEFEARLAAMIAAEPDMYFARSEIVRLPEELRESKEDTYQTARAIADAARLGRHPRNVDSCWRFGHACDFYAVCSGAGSLDDDTMFRRDENKHPELVLEQALEVE